jgi:cerevisin
MSLLVSCKWFITTMSVSWLMRNSWAAEQAAAADATASQEHAATGKSKHKGSVANMSLGGGKAKALDDAVNAAVEAGLHFAVAAGNDNKDACDYSPAGATNAVTVGASTLGDERAYFSNHGKCVDVFAPGLGIMSTWNGGNETTNTISGTSMASPHICGLLAYLLSIHGSTTFSILDFASDAAQTSAVTPSVYAQAYSFLPKLAQAVLPAPVDQLLVAPNGDNLRPVPKPTPGDGKLTPAILKKALIALASPGMITGDLPSGTPNLLAFNNATLPEKK